MDTLLFYKNNTDLKPVIEQVKFSYKRPYKTVYAHSPGQLKERLKIHREGLLYFFSDNLDQAERVMVRNIRHARPGMKVCLCSHHSFALDAWNMNVFHFLAQPVKGEGLLRTYRKYLEENVSLTATLSLKTNEGLVEIPLNDICYIKAAGNYSFIQSAGDKSYLQTRQLQHYEDLEESDNNIRRVHRSLITNFKKIRKVGNKEILFYQVTKPLKISKALEMKIKKILLGKA